MENVKNQEIASKQNDMLKKGKKIVPFLITLIGTLMVVVAFFLPYASATDEYKEVLESYSQELYFKEISMTNKDVINISMLEFARIYSAADKLGQSVEVGVTCVVLIAFIAFFSLLTLLFVGLKKPILILVFECLTFAVFRLLSWDFKERGVMPSSSYNWGISYYIHHIGALILFVGVIWMLVTKIKEKKRNKNYKI